jgi:hypothetical protein
MSVDLTRLVWEEIKHYIGKLDRTDAADALVDLLIDNNFSADEIRTAFKGDSEVKQALTAYLADHSDDEEVDDDYENNDDDDDDEDYDSKDY